MFLKGISMSFFVGLAAAGDGGTCAGERGIDDEASLLASRLAVKQHSKGSVEAGTRVRPPTPQGYDAENCNIHAIAKNVSPQQVYTNLDYGTCLYECNVRDVSDNDCAGIAFDFTDTYCFLLDDSEKKIIEGLPVPSAYEACVVNMKVASTDAEVPDDEYEKYIEFQKKKKADAEANEYEKYVEFQKKQKAEAEAKNKEGNVALDGAAKKLAAADKKLAAANAKEAQAVRDGTVTRIP